MKRKAIVCDIDGVLLDSEHIMQESEDLELYGDLKWDYFYNHCNDVEVISETKKYIDSFVHATYEVEVEPNVITIDSVTLIVSTARNEKCRVETIDKLAQHEIFFNRMYMRKDGDLRPASEVKREHLIKIMKEFDVIAFIDDDLQNCEMAKSLGILSLRRV